MKGREELGPERPREFSGSPISMGYGVPLKTTLFSGARVLETLAAQARDFQVLVS